MAGHPLNVQSKIFVGGHRGLVGSAVLRALQNRGFKNLITRTHQELDLENFELTRKFFQQERPEFVILAAAKVGGIGANSNFPVEFLLSNLRIQNNVISQAAEFGTAKLVFLGSSCIYPRDARYPLTEDQLLTGPFEPTNEGYALAKVCGIKLCQYYAQQYGKNFISLMPTNLYGPQDDYDFNNSHVIPAMLLKVLKAKKEGAKFVTLWGSGRAYREFLHSDDLASAIVLCLERYDSPELINIGSEEEITILELAQLICKVCQFDGEVVWDATKPDGLMRRVMDSSRIRQMGWKPQITLEAGIRSVLDEAAQKLK